MQPRMFAKIMIYVTSEINVPAVYIIWPFSFLSKPAEVKRLLFIGSLIYLFYAELYLKLYA